MNNYLGDFPVGKVIDFKWNTFAAAGGSVDRATNGSIRIYKGSSTTERSSSAGITDTEAFDTLVGVHHLTIDTSDNTDAGFYAAGNDFQVVLQGAVIDGQTVNAVIAHFSLENRGLIHTILQGTAQGGSTTYVDLPTTAVNTDDYYNDTLVAIIAGTGAGQSRFISDYASGASRRATVAEAWITAPDSTSVIQVLKGSKATLSGTVSANMTQINGSSADAVRLQQGASAMVVGTVSNTGFTPTTTEFECSDITDATASHWINRTVINLTGARKGQFGGKITAYTLTGGRGHFTVDGFTTAPSNGDSILVV